MELPGDSVGISDILAHRECPRRMSFGMRRHTGKGEQSDAATPEALLYGAAEARIYGSAIHELLHLVEEGYSDDEAIRRTWRKYGRFLDPTDLQLLRDDLATYQHRDFPNTRTVLSEEDVRVPLYKRGDRWIFFRFRVDRLYERVDVPGYFIHLDYKSSKHVKSKLDVQNDLQLWSYNWGLHEYLPEIERLQQIYDQLRFGREEARKNDHQRGQIKAWLIENVEAIFDDEDWQEDGLLAHSLNDWCPWCPILESCGVVHEVTEWTATRLMALAPQEKDGRKTIVHVEPSQIDKYVAQFDKARVATGILERFTEAVRDMLRDMPADQVDALGFEFRGRRNTIFDAQAIEAMHEILGPRLYEVVGVTKARLESVLGDDPAVLRECLDKALTMQGRGTIVRKK